VFRARRHRDADGALPEPGAWPNRLAPPAGSGSASSPARCIETARTPRCSVCCDPSKQRSGRSDVPQHSPGAHRTPPGRGRFPSGVVRSCR
jgi:hypothetical protein